MSTQIPDARVRAHCGCASALASRPVLYSVAVTRREEFTAGEPPPTAHHLGSPVILKMCHILSRSVTTERARATHTYTVLTTPWTTHRLYDTAMELKLAHGTRNKQDLSSNRGRTQWNGRSGDGLDLNKAVCTEIHGKLISADIPLALPVCTRACSLAADSR